MTTIRFDDELLDGLRQVAERDGILIPEQVRRAVKAWLITKGVQPSSTPPPRKKARSS